jgi:hypothetical protein
VGGVELKLDCRQLDLAVMSDADEVVLELGGGELNYFGLLLQPVPYTVIPRHIYRKKYLQVREIPAASLCTEYYNWKLIIIDFSRPKTNWMRISTSLVKFTNFHQFPHGPRKKRSRKRDLTSHLYAARCGRTVRWRPGWVCSKSVRRLCSTGVLHEFGGGISLGKAIAYYTS